MIERKLDKKGIMIVVITTIFIVLCNVIAYYSLLNEQITLNAQYVNISRTTLWMWAILSISMTTIFSLFLWSLIYRIVFILVLVESEYSMGYSFYSFVVAGLPYSVLLVVGELAIRNVSFSNNLWMEILSVLSSTILYIYLMLKNINVSSRKVCTLLVILFLLRGLWMFFT